MEDQAPTPTLQSQSATTADRQLSSPFFSVLPPEVRRMIYAQVWRHNRLHSDARDQTQARCLKYHIVKRQSGGYGHTPCVVSDQTVPDVQSQRLAVFPEPCIRSDIWIDRIESDWAVHWPCEESYRKHAAHGRPSRSSFMSPLLTCKLMYLECHESLYSSLTFVFTDTITAESFISLFPPPTFRSLELAVRIPLVLRELYLPEASFSPSSSPHLQRSSIPANFPFDSTNNPWAKLCAALAACTSLRSLNMWFDIKHLDGWAGRVWETIFFADLWKVEVRRGGMGGRERGGGRFVLALPELGRRPGRQQTTEMDAGIGDGAYLVGDAVQDAPFTVVRGMRPNYWAAHIARIRARQDVLTIDAPPPAVLDEP